jgi:DNA-binding transcriptional LysR family regulator
MLDRLTLDQLRILVAVAESGSFSAAARRLGRVQSAISQAVQNLERSLDIALFDRAGKQPVLTEAGRVILDDARHLLRSAENLRARAQSIASEIEPELSLAFDRTFPADILAIALKGLAEQFPNLPVTLFSESYDGGEKRLRDGSARLAIYPAEAGAPGDLASELLWVLMLIPVVAADHPLARLKPPLSLAQLQPHVQLIRADNLMPPTSYFGGLLSSRLWRFSDMRTRLDYVLGGFGWSMMPEHYVAEHLASGRLKRLELRVVGKLQLQSPLHVAHLPSHPPGRAGRWLIEELRRRLEASSKTKGRVRRRAG